MIDESGTGAQIFHLFVRANPLTNFLHFFNRKLEADDLSCIKMSPALVKRPVVNNMKFPLSCCASVIICWQNSAECSSCTGGVLVINTYVSARML